MTGRITVTFVIVLLLPTLAACTESPAEESSDQKVVLITGASTGLGRAMAERMAENGYFVYAGARKQEDLDSLNAMQNMRAIRIDVNVYGVMRMSSAFTPLLLESQGRIINIGSIAGSVGFDYIGPYTMSKHAMEAYTESLHAELAPLGVSRLLYPDP
jgi:NAD(P)-dependent dehydrogenase (short-subunit alcohol dehydrogenase family)